MPTIEHDHHTTALTESARHPRFPDDPTGLPACAPTEIVELDEGDAVHLRVAPVAQTIGNLTVRMLAFNGSIPGPTLRVRQGSTATVVVHNDADHETTVHWHGLRVLNQYDGVPGETQEATPVGGTFTYELRFPDDGVYWYHPHVREDYGLEMGLYGNIIVDPARPEPAAAMPDREAIVTLDDILIEDDHIQSFNIDTPSHTAMGRFGNVMLTSGSSDLALHAGAGDVVRFFLTNTANARIFNFTIPGASLKLVGGDSGRYEHETFVESILLAPSERAVVDAAFEQAGRYRLAHLTPDQAYLLGTVTVSDDAPGELRDSFWALRANGELMAERRQLDERRDFGRVPDKTLLLTAEMPLLRALAARSAAGMWTCPMHPDVVSETPGSCPICGMSLIPSDAHTDMQGHGHGHHMATDDPPSDGLEWEDLMPELNQQTDDTNMLWKLVDVETGAVNGDIDWAFRVGDRVKIRLVNTMDGDHPMHHPFHVHGAGRFLILDRDGTPEANLVWKDTVLLRAGETVDVLLVITSPGRWMAHCHIAEHNQDGMMFSFDVQP